MMNRTRTLPTLRSRLSWLLIGVLTATVLAGCIQPSDDSPDDGEGPQAVLQADRTERWAGELFTLDGRNSSAGDDEVTRWQFDLGDGTTLQGENLSQAVVKHDYAHGGAYQAVFTITTGDIDGENVSTSAQKTLTVNERTEIEEQILYAGPLNEAPPGFNETPTQRGGQAFRAYPNATDWETDVRLSNSMPAGDTEVTVRVHNRDNHTLTEENTTIPAGENRTLRLSGSVQEPDLHGVEIIVHSGGVQSHGTIRVYYEAPDDPGSS